MKENPDLEVVKKEHLKEVEDKAKLWDQNQEQERRKKEASDAKTWQEEASPEEATIRKVELYSKRHESKDLSNQIPSGNTGENIHSYPVAEKGESTSPAPDPADNKAKGDWGEECALNYLEKKYSPKEVIWLNDRGCVGKGYDIVRKKNGEEIAHFEVKSTTENKPTPGSPR